MTRIRKYTAEFRFYAQLNDFLLPPFRQIPHTYQFDAHPGIKDPIEVFGIPHTEVGLILANGQAVNFSYQLQANDRVAVYPFFKMFDMKTFPLLREKYSIEPRFILDVNLGKLAKRLRLLGFDCLYRNDYQDAELVNIAVDEKRIVLTRDRRLLFAKQLEHGYWVRNVEVTRQIEEVLQYFELHDFISPFARCMMCNGILVPVAKADILDRLEPKTRLYYETFYQCNQCRHIYWNGSHLEDMQQRFFSVIRGGEHDFTDDTMDRISSG